MTQLSLTRGRTHWLTSGCAGKISSCVIYVHSVPSIPHTFLSLPLTSWPCRIGRGESQLPSSNVHFFTSHFMTTLKDDGPEAVASWTAKKNINVFEKKLIFIPVNADLHWSLCVVVNPGLIANSFDTDISEDEEHSL